MSEYVTKNIFIGGKKGGAKRLRNLEKVADEFYAGNFSKMVNDLLDKTYHLDPVTGERLQGRPNKGTWQRPSNSVFAPPVPPTEYDR